MPLEKHECWLDSEEIKGECAIKTFQIEDGTWHWILIRIRDLKPIAACCQKIQQEAKPS